MNFRFMDLAVKRDAQEYRNSLDKEFARCNCMIKRFQEYYQERLDFSNISVELTDFEHNLFFLNNYCSQVAVLISNIREVLKNEVDEKYGTDLADECIARFYCFLDMHTSYVNNFLDEATKKSENFMKFDVYANMFSRLASELNIIIDLLSLDKKLTKVGCFIKLANAPSHNRYTYAQEKDY